MANDTIVVTPDTDGINVSLTLSSPFLIEMGFSEIDTSSSYLLVDNDGPDIFVTTQAPSFLLGTGKTLPGIKVSRYFSIPLAQVYTDSNLIDRPIIFSRIANIHTELDNDFLLSKTDDTEFHIVFNKVKQENWNTEDVPQAVRKIWSDTIANLTSKTARNIMTRLHNRYSANPRIQEKRQVNNSFVINL